MNKTVSNIRHRFALILFSVLSFMPKRKRIMLGTMLIVFIAPSCRNNTIHCYTGPAVDTTVQKKDTAAFIKKDSAKHDPPVKTCYAPPRDPKNK
ncbi:MAG: hypothetical protein V2A54_09015 [Bacteroidota bacterium]